MADFILGFGPAAPLHREVHQLNGSLGAHKEESSRDLCQQVFSYSFPILVEIDGADADPVAFVHMKSAERGEAALAPESG
ncbi:MAG: hypothetical protein FJ387_29995 [Verrucomicrobia bacterium]|nr:hypothetical protein [Verrucomicrobiota bacterium]